MSFSETELSQKINAFEEKIHFKTKPSEPLIENSEDSCDKMLVVGKPVKKVEEICNGSNVELSDSIMCHENDKTCFSCKKTDENLINCSIKSCGKSYHKDCLTKLPTSKADLNLCPHHVCVSCYYSIPKNSQAVIGKMLKCEVCPTAFHDTDQCHIPGTVVKNNGFMLCAGHFSPEIQRKYSRIPHLTFCIECHCNEDLVFCETCPSAIHQTCCKTKKNITGDFICDRCKVKKFFHYSDIVWAKVYNFRWWPGCIVKPADLPAHIKTLQHFDGEFAVRFFGTNEYYWVQKDRVHPFNFKHVGIEDSNIKHNFKKIIPDSTFEDAVQLALTAMSGKKSIQAMGSLSHSKPPPYKHVKCNKPIGDVQIYTSHDLSDLTSCGCTPEEACSYDSLCLNRSMLTECHPDVCEAGENCQNQKFQKVENAAVKPFWTQNRGWALKSIADIKKGHFIIEYCGDLIDEEECERRIKEKQAIGDTNFYFCTLDGARIIDAGPKGNFSRFMNHSCNPNCETQKWIVNGDARVGIFAKHDIPSGSELTFDYQMDFSHYEKLKCNCGAKQCSGLIGKKPQNGVSHFAGSDEDEPANSGQECSSNESTKKPTKNGLKIKENYVKVGSNKKKILKDRTPAKKVKENCLKKKENGKLKSIKSKLLNNKSPAKEVKEDKLQKKKRDMNSYSIKKRLSINKLSAREIKENGLMTKEKDTKPVSKKLNVVKNKLTKDKQLCFKCKTGGKQLNCSDESCGKSFHLRCLRPSFSAKDKIPLNWKCPRHFCMKCKENAVYHCFMCPNSYCIEHVHSQHKKDKFACYQHLYE